MQSYPPFTNPKNFQSFTCYFSISLAVYHLHIPFIFKSLLYLHGRYNIKWWQQCDVKYTPKPIKHYWLMKECLSVQDWLETKGKCIVIPKSMQSIVLKGIHATHQGITKWLLKARKSLYWRGIRSDVENMVRTCEICREHQRKNSKETMLIKEQATRPFQNSNRYFPI